MPVVGHQQKPRRESFAVLNKRMLSSRRVKRTSAVLGLLLLVGLAVVSLIVEMEADYTVETVAESGTAKALVLFHPSRDARFSDDLAMAFAEGLKIAGFAVRRATLTRATPGDAEGYALIGVVTNTYYWAPDLPTLRYLDRARLQGVPAVGLVGGAGSTARSQRMLEEALRQAGAKVIETRSFWLWRPNDESRMKEPNREVALQLARQLGTRTGRSVLSAKQEAQ